MSSCLQSRADLTVDLELAKTPNILGDFSSHLHLVVPYCPSPDIFLEDLNLSGKKIIKSWAQRCFHSPPFPTHGCGWGRRGAVSLRRAGPRLLAGAHLARQCVSSRLVEELEPLQPDVFHFICSSLPASGLAGSPAAADCRGSGCKSAASS